MRIIPLAAATLLCPAAMADVTFSVRAGDGTFWTNNLGTDGCLIPEIHVGVFAHFTNAYALASATFNVTATKSRMLSTPDRTLIINGAGLGRQAPFALGSNSQAIFFSTGGWRIDEASDVSNSPSAGISYLQGPSSPSTANDVLLYQFTLNPSCSLTGVEIGLTVSETSAAVYPSQGAPPVAAQIGTSSRAGIIFVPTPAPLALLGGVAPIILRRRR